MNITEATERVDRIAARVGPTLVRWLAGLLWLTNVNWKTPTDFGKTAQGCAGLCGFTAAGVEHPVVPGSAWFFEQVVLPHLTLFGWASFGIELALGAMLLSGRFLRTAAVLGMAQSVVIGLAVANAPAEWFWAYLLMFGLHLAVLVQAPRDRPTGARAMGIVTIAFGVIVAVAHAQAGLTGDGEPGWTLFAGAAGTIRDIPDEFGRNLFSGSLALGGLLVLLGVAAIVLDGRPDRVRQTAGWVLVGVAVAASLTYRSTELAIGLGATAATAGMVGALGLSLTSARRPPVDAADG